MTETAHFRLNAFLKNAAGEAHPIEILVEGPSLTVESTYQCTIRTSILNQNPYRVYSGLAHDAWAEAFEVLNRALVAADAVLFDEQGKCVELPSPPRDRSWVPPPRIPVVDGIDPIYRAEGWAKRPDREPRRIELAIWPPFEEEPGTFCAPMKNTLRGERPLICSYGAFPEQAVYLAYSFLRVTTETYELSDDKGQSIIVPSPPEPPLPEDW
jgi:hypothetical protein